MKQLHPSLCNFWPTMLARALWFLAERLRLIFAFDSQMCVTTPTPVSLFHLNIKWLLIAALSKLYIWDPVKLADVYFSTWTSFNLVQKNLWWSRTTFLSHTTKRISKCTEINIRNFVRIEIKNELKRCIKIANACLAFIILQLMSNQFLRWQSPGCPNDWILQHLLNFVQHFNFCTLISIKAYNFLFIYQQTPQSLTTCSVWTVNFSAVTQKSKVICIFLNIQCTPKVISKSFVNLPPWITWKEKISWSASIMFTKCGGRSWGC